ncbi:hypothetical protein L3Q82_007357 [Scortum barcoo]|uniref:Uncharacterized protein n=1 Tax=Scortum barcoo TaxID=214431 RepID=A0ACB8WSY4_9TELE|nr:hypothetical protein L3Q82_007357 [Scortum barcoo]
MSHREEASGKTRPRTRWRNYVSRLAWERLGVPPEELEEVSGSDSLRKETVLVSGCFGVQSSVAPAGGEEVKQVMSRV